jgi:ABC-type Na+ efflux pump permease subunit
MLQRMKMKYGVQIPVGLAVFIIVMLLIFKLNVLKSAAAALLSFIVLSFVEALSFFVLTKVTNYPEDIMIRGTDFERLILSLPPLVVITFIALFMQWRLYNKKEPVNYS